ncbi:guanitoxin biosynthesis MATE family efflux transporter GntT [Leptolyngbya sp. NK1-12]|nr:guanitoxin biosynthesis MATE family efflux transporter GntT [Leptolyngbya sp. NK1-12]
MPPSFMPPAQSSQASHSPPLLVTDLDQSLSQRFFRLAIVNILSNLTVPLAGLVSVAFLGHLVEIRYLAGVTLATVLFNYLYRTLGFLRMGTTGVTAQAVGRNDRAAILLTALRNGILAVGLGLIILLLQHPIRDLGFAVLSAEPVIKAAGQAYYDARIWAAPATLLNFVLIGSLLGQEKSGQVLLISALGNGANILLDYFFVVRWGWNSAGAGWAITVSQYLMALLGLVLCARQTSWLEIQAIQSKLWDTAAFKSTLTLNGNIFIRTLAFLSTFSVFTNFSSAIGAILLAENALLLQVFSFAVYLIDGLAFATESLTGVLHGQGNKKPLLGLISLSGGSSLVIGVTFALLFVLFPMPLFALLTNHTEVLAQIGRYVFWLIPVLGFGSIAFMLDGYFLGLAEGATLRNAALFATLFGFVPLVVWAWQLQSNDLLWLALSVFMAARVVFLGSQVLRTIQ